MKVLAIYIVHVFKSQSSSAASSNQNGENSKIIVMASDLSSVGWFSRGSVQQVMNFTARTVSERTPPGQRSTIDELEYTAYIFRPVKHPKLSVVTVTDKEYPHRAADCIGPQVISDFTASFRESEYTDISKPQLFWPQLDAKLTQYQQPSQAMDKVAKIQSELDATTEVMHKNIEQVLQRGERLEDLMERTEELDNATKLFVKQAKKANRSDRALKDSTYDKCSDLIRNLLKNELSDIETVTKYVDDDIRNIRSVLNELIKEELDLILCSGGTGLTERDVTPEAVIPLLTKRATGIEMGIMNYGMQKTKFAVLSRPVAGTIGKSIIVCMPGSPKACQEVLEYLIPLIPHLVRLVTGQDTKSHPVAVNAKSIAVNECRCGDNSVSNRPRESPFEIIEVHEALERVRRACDALKLETEVVLIKNAAGRIIALDILSQVNVPNVRTSILDGYAFKLDPNCNITKLKVMGYTTAGTFDEKLNDYNGNEYCVRVNTGSFVPDWCTYVVMVEDTKVIELTADGEEAVIEISRMPNIPSIREVGSDIAKGELICKKGTRITDGTLGCLILSGLKEVVVHKTVKVVVLSTGDEVADINTTELLKPGQLFDSNRPAIISMLSKFQHVDIIDAGIHKDDDLSVNKILKQHNPDIVISSGGVSMGEKDNLKKLFEESGCEILFGRIRMKPGKPLTVAKYKRKNDSGTGLWFGLPGNPVSAVVCSYLFVCPALRSFYNEFKHHYVTAKLEYSEPLKCDKYRVEYMRCVVQQDTSGERTVTVPVTNQVSSNMRSFIECNALMICDNKSGILKYGDLMKCIMLNSLT